MFPRLKGKHGTSSVGDSPLGGVAPEPKASGGIANVAGTRGTGEAGEAGEAGVVTLPCDSTSSKAVS
jgi:hypothetical protein